MAALRIGSVLIADCGSTMTTVALVDRVNGHFRFVARGEAPSTHANPWADLSVGVRYAVHQIENLVGRKVLDKNEKLITPRSGRSGVDAFVLVASAGPPVSTLLVGLSERFSIFNAKQALKSAPVVLAATLAPDENEEHSLAPQHRLDVMRRIGPELIVITGGTDGGAGRPLLELVQVVDLYVQELSPGSRPVTFFAGNRMVWNQVKEIFSGSGEIYLAANPRPTLENENPAPLRSEIENFCEKRQMSRLPGIETLSSWANDSPTSTLRSFGRMVDYVSRRYELNVLGVDLGSQTTVLAAQQAVDADDETLEPDLLVCSDLGMGVSIPSTLSQITMQRILRWMPVDLDPDQARDTLLNKALAPHTVAQAPQDLYLEYGLAREILREAAGQTFESGPAGQGSSRQWDLIVAAGRTLTRTPHPALAMLMLLDGIEPIGVCKMTLDISGVAGMLGALAAVHPLAAVELVEYDAFLTLGTVIGLAGKTEPGTSALRASITYPDGKQQDIEVASGSLQLVPLKPNQHARLELHPTRNFDAGIGQAGQGMTVEVEGGMLGVVIDARGRPLPAPDGNPSWIAQWLQNLGLTLPPSMAAVHHQIVLPNPIYDVQSVAQ
jgi:hypothetical protein